MDYDTFDWLKSTISKAMLATTCGISLLGSFLLILLLKNVLMNDEESEVALHFLAVHPWFLAYLVGAMFLGAGLALSWNALSKFFILFFFIAWIAYEIFVASHYDHAIQINVVYTLAVGFGVGTLLYPFLRQR